MRNGLTGGISSKSSSGLGGFGGGGFGSAGAGDGGGGGGFSFGNLIYFSSDYTQNNYIIVINN